MRYTSPDNVHEPMYADGALMLRPLQLALLHGLLDRPGATAPSRVDCARAALPYTHLYCGGEQSTSSLICAVRRVVKSGWVTQQRVGRHVTYTLTPRGQAIVNGDVPVRLFARGPWAPRSRRRAA
jgi:hypothetical protein